MSFTNNFVINTWIDIPIFENFSGFKENLSDALVELISPINAEIIKLMDDRKYLDSIIKEGSEKANERAKKTLTEVYDIIGLVKNET